MAGQFITSIEYLSTEGSGCSIEYSKIMILQRQFSIIVVVVAFASLPAFVSADMHYTPDPGSCEIIGNPDLYGIGVRVGFYLNWAAMCLAIMLVPDHAILTFISINLLNLSIFICFFANMFRGGVSNAFLSLEIWIVLGETFMLEINLVYAAFWIFESLERFRPTLCLIMFIYSLICFGLAYIMAIGRVSEQREACLPLFEHTNKSTQIVTTVFFAFLGLAIFAFCLWNLWRTFRYNRPTRPHAHGHEPRHILWQILGGWKSRINSVKVLIIILAVGIGIGVIVRIENILKTYEINTAEASFTSAGQLNPFFLGLFNLLYVLWRSYEQGVAAWPLTYWCHEMRIYLDYSIYWSKISSQFICMRLSKSRKSSWDLSTP